MFDHLSRLEYLSFKMVKIIISLMYWVSKDIEILCSSNVVSIIDVYKILIFNIALTSSEASDQPLFGSAVVECLTRDLRAAGSSLTGVTVLWSLSKTHLS